METGKRRSSRFVLAVGVLIVVGILFLELGSRWYFPDQSAESEDFSLPPAAVCDPALYPPDPTRLAVLEALAEGRRRGEPISPIELEAALIAAPQEDLPYRNGVFCEGQIYVSQRLKSAARRYVARHELEHYFQVQGLDPDCQDWELCATWAAARDHPLGFLATIGSSLVEAYCLSPSLWDFLFGAWAAFRIYLLP